MVKNRNKESDEENNYVSLEGSTKNQKARTIELNKEAKYILQKIKYSRDSSLPDEFIVTTKTGKINTASNLEHRMKVIMKKKVDCIFSEKHLQPECMKVVHE